MGNNGNMVPMIGLRFGMLTVLSRDNSPQSKGTVKYHCICECGIKKSINGLSLRQGKTKSCSCKSAIENKKRSTHGLADAPTHIVWMGMRQRCNNPKNRNFRYYGGRGIKVCKRWDKFENFLADMGLRPTGLTIDRYPDNNGHYERDNCRWATRKQQSNNKRR